ncbi:hypothetical protein SLEP1_g50594 [Rubroshorea leprosula]|uniref:Uncharacterized protein n=1 Tax=Rubroshorea leprosula TaxID=152421 RepID=A0AAV5M0J3_9ROSI|nr:hypothetical protein SLEP1_g50594 [Rubroshorea leprosula]
MEPNIGVGFLWKAHVSLGIQAIKMMGSFIRGAILFSWQKGNLSQF